MSGSKDKQNRKELKEQGLHIENSRDAAEQTKARKQTIIYRTVLIAFIVVAIIVLYMNSGFYYRTMPAMQVNGQSYSIAEYNFYYRSAYLNEMNNGYGSYFIDNNTPLSEQAYTYDSTMTWDDYFSDQAETNMRTIQMLLTDAEANGMTELDEEHQQDLDDSLETLKENVAESTDYPTTSKYLQAYYGKGMTYNLYVELATKAQLATQYAEKVGDDYKDSYSDEDLESYYSEHADEYDRFTYRSYTVAVEVAEETTDDAAATDDTTATDDAAATDDTTATDDTAATEDTTDDAATAEAKAKADAIAAATSEEDFKNLVYENCTEDQKATYATDAEDDATLTGDKKTGSNLQDYDYADWLFDSARVAGDTTVVESEGSYVVLYFIERDTNQETLANARHILIEPEEEEETTEDTATTDDTATEEETNPANTEALQKAEEILAEWEEGDATEDSFAALAEEYSSDTGSNKDGGLYEDIYPGQMVETFNDWVFDESRQTGDVDIVESDYGYHVMYFASKSDETYWHYLAQTNKESEDYDAWEAEQLNNYTASTNSLFMRWTYSTRR